MIYSVLVNQGDLEQIAEYTFRLREITLTHSTNKAKAALLTSFKQSLQLALQQNSKKKEIISLQEPSSAKKTQNRQFRSNAVSGDSDSSKLSASNTMRIHHKIIINKICAHFQLRNHLSISVYQLQKQFDILSSKHRKWVRDRDGANQTKGISGMRGCTMKMRQVLESLTTMRDQLCVQHEMLRDNIKLLKVKNSTMKAQLACNKLSHAIIKDKHLKKCGKGMLDSLEMDNENKNQILVNL